MPSEPRPPVPKKISNGLAMDSMSERPIKNEKTKGLENFMLNCVRVTNLNCQFASEHRI